MPLASEYFASRQDCKPKTWQTTSVGNGAG